MNKRWKLVFLGFTALLLILLIFNFSSQDGPSSDSISKSIASFVKYIHDYFFEKEISLSYLNHIIRKLAHFSIFGFLGLVLSIIFTTIGFEKSKVFALALSISTTYALFDEFHQLFVPDRGAEFKDVLIDFSGALIAIIIYLNIKKDKN